MLFRTLSIPFILLALPILGYLAICVMLFFRQDRMIFFPSHHADGEFDDMARAAGFEPWRDSDGAFLGWKKLRPDATRVILACHGNAGSAIDRFSLAPILSGGPPINLYLLEYPGYGSREGAPSERSLVDAAVSAVDKLSETGNLPIWLLGESLGTGVVGAAAGQRRNTVDGLVLVTPFDSLVGAAQVIYPWLPVAALVRHRFDSVTNLAPYSGPIAIIIGGQDFTTPPVLGKRLAEAFESTSRVWLIDDAGHNDTSVLLDAWPEISQWLADNEAGRSAAM